MTELQLFLGSFAAGWAQLDNLSAVQAVAVVGLDVNYNGQKGQGGTEAGWSDSGLEHSNRLASVVRAEEDTPAAGAQAD